jgi:hypothetical protein
MFLSKQVESRIQRVFLLHPRENELPNNDDATGLEPISTRAMAVGENEKPLSGAISLARDLSSTSAKAKVDPTKRMTIIKENVLISIPPYI